MSKKEFPKHIKRVLVIGGPRSKAMGEKGLKRRYNNVPNGTRIANWRRVDSLEEFKRGYIKIMAGLPYSEWGYILANGHEDHPVFSRPEPDLELVKLFEEGTEL